MFWISAALKAIGFLGLVSFKKNIMNSILSIEIMIIGSVINFCSIMTKEGTSFAIIVLTIAAGEAALGFTVCFFAQRMIVI